MHEGPVVVFSGGGTGGHLYPALAIADALRERRSDVRAFFVGSARGIEADILPERGEEHHLLPVHGIDRSRPLSAWRVGPAMASSVYSVSRLFQSLRPDVVVVTGGYASAPSGVVAAFRGIPLLIQEQNSVPGLTTRSLSRWAETIHVAFPEAVERLPRRARGRVRVTGNPARAASERSPMEARTLYGLPGEGPVLLIVGGSQGSVALNAVVEEAVRGVVEGGLHRPGQLHVLWSTGPRHYEGVTEGLRAFDHPDWVHVLPYIGDMPAALAAADLAVSRAGAMFTAELLNQGLPSILVPLPTAAADHQTHNASALAGAGAAVVTPQAGLTGDILWAEVVRLTTDGDALSRMRTAALSLARPGAASEIAAAVEELLDAGSRSG